MQGKMEYKTNGLQNPSRSYAAGNPDRNSPVLVTSNYKLTFDMLRKELSGIDVWIMVLDTDGVNVWCAAGKGTFGTAEVIKRIKLSKLDKIVSHKKIILPQLGASGVAFHTVLKEAGFRVIYGPVLSKDIKEFIKQGMKADENMRRVNFPIKNRIILTPVEIVGSFKLLILLFIFLLILNIISMPAHDPAGILIKTIFNSIPFLGAVCIGCVIVPALLPYIPFRAFSLKGFIASIFWSAYVILNPEVFALSGGLLSNISYFALISVLSSYLSLNFTGRTTYTSLSGVKKEMEKVIPIMAFSALSGFVFLIIGKIVNI
jgi:hypothetical protein